MTWGRQSPAHSFSANLHSPGNTYFSRLLNQSAPSTQQNLSALSWSLFWPEASCSHGYCWPAVRAPPAPCLTAPESGWRPLQTLPILWCGDPQALRGPEHHQLHQLHGWGCPCLSDPVPFAREECVVCRYAWLLKSGCPLVFAHAWP